MMMLYNRQEARSHDRALNTTTSSTMTSSHQQQESQHQLSTLDHLVAVSSLQQLEPRSSADNAPYSSITASAAIWNARQRLAKTENDLRLWHHHQAQLMNAHHRNGQLTMLLNQGALYSRALSRYEPPK